MKTGKISESILKRSVLRYCTKQRPDVLQGAGAGRDCAVIDAGGGAWVSCSVHPSAADSILKVRYSLEHAVNNLACSGCLPVSVMLTVLLPEEAQEERLREIMEEASGVCAELRVQICGGHTEVSSAVREPVLAVTALGRCERKLPGPAGICPGMDILVAGTVGREGTALLLESSEKALREHFPLDFVEEARKLGRSISIAREASAAASFGAAAMHDASQGGIFGALWEMLEGAKAGMEADLRKIPIRQETVEICEFFGINPYCLLSGGALLIAAKNGRQMAAQLRGQGIEAAVIGRVTEGNDRILRNKDEIRFLDRPAQDEFYRHAMAERSGVWRD